MGQLLGGAEPPFRPALALHRPAGWRNPALHLPLGAAGDIFTHPEALLYIDGRPLASADRYHHTVDLDTALADGKPHDLHAPWLDRADGLAARSDGPLPAVHAGMRVIDIDRELQGFLTLAGTALELSRGVSRQPPRKALDPVGARYAPSWRSTPATRWATRSAPACPRRRSG
jgi:hypothetical protein